MLIATGKNSKSAKDDKGKEIQNIPHDLGKLILFVVSIFILLFVIILIIPITSKLLFPFFSRFISSPIISTDAGRWLIGGLGTLAITIITKVFTGISGKDMGDQEHVRNGAKNSENFMKSNNSELPSIKQRKLALKRKWVIIAAGVASFIAFVLILIYIPKQVVDDQGTEGLVNSDLKDNTLNSTSGAASASQAEKEEVNITITLTAKEQMTFQNLEAARATIKKRVQLLGENREIDIQTEDSRIILSMPLSIFDNSDVETIIKACISRPLRLFIVETDGLILLEAHEILRDMISSVEVVQADTIESILSDNDIPIDPNQYFLKITLSSEGIYLVNQMFTKGLEENTNVFFAQDAEEFKTSFIGFDYSFAENDRSVVYISNTLFHTKEYFESLAYSYQNEPLSDAFPFNYRLDPEASWEVVQTTGEKGKYQRNLDEIGGDTALLEISRYTPDITEGELVDQVDLIRNRMDMITIPYCLGYSFINPLDIMIKTSTERIGPDILAILSASSFDLTSSLRSLYDDITSSFKSMTIEQDASGYYFLRVTVNDYDLGEIKDESKKLVKSSGRFYLCANDSIICASSLSETVDDGSIVFDLLPFITGQHKITKDQLFILNMIHGIFNEDNYQHSFSAKLVYLDSDDPSKEAVQFGVPHINEEDQFIEETLVNLVPEAEMYTSADNTGTLNILLHGEMSAGFIQRALDQTSKIFQECNMDQSSYSTIMFQLVDETNNQRCRLLFMDDLNGEAKKCIGICSGDIIGTYFDEFVQCALKDNFFKIHNFQMLED